MSSEDMDENANVNNGEDREGDVTATMLPDSKPASDDQTSTCSMEDDVITALLPDSKPESDDRTPACTMLSFGKIDFDDHAKGKKFSVYSKTRKFVKVNVPGDKEGLDKRLDDIADELLKAILEKWKLVGARKRPQLLISVLGGAWDFPYSGHVKEVFQRGIVQAAVSANAWIVTPGTNVGVSKYVGKAVADYKLAKQNDIITIGITSWGTLREDDRDKMTRQMKHGERATLSTPKANEKGIFLDPNHSYFILINDGKSEFRTVQTFKETLQRKICSKWKIQHSSEDTPMVTIAIEGGRGTFTTAMKVIKDEHQNPLVVVANSGRASSRMSDLVRNIQKMNKCNLETDVISSESLTEDPDEDEVNTAEKNLETFYDAPESLTVYIDENEFITAVEENKHLVSVIEDKSTEPVDQSILKAVVAANKVQHLFQLELAQAWDRSDIIDYNAVVGSITHGSIHEKSYAGKEERYKDLVLKCLANNQHRIVKMCLNNNIVQFDKYLNKEKLGHLYKEVISQGQKLKEEGDKNFEAEEYENALASYTNALKITSESDGNRVGYYTNRAACHIKLENCEKALDDALAAFKISPADTKSLLEQYQPRESLGTIKNSFREARSSNQLEPWNTAVKSKLEKLGEQIKKKECRTKKNKMSELERVEKRLKRLTTESFKLLTGDNKTRRFRVKDADILPDPYRQLFLFALLNKYYEIAEYFWEEGDEHIAAALTASRIYKQMAQKENSETRGIMYKHAKKYEEWAFDILSDIEDQSDKDDTSDILTRTSPKWGNANHLHLAENARCLNFISHPAVQRLLDKVWCSGLSNKALPEHKVQIDQAVWNWFTNPTPKTKFWLNTIMNVLFLVYFSYVMVSGELVKEEISFHELILFVWVISLICEEIRELMMPYINKNSKLSIKGQSGKLGRIKAYVHSIWNYIDISMLFLFVFGEVLQWCFQDFRAHGRILFAFSLFIHYIRFLQSFTVFRNTGTKILMIFKSLADFGSMVLILVTILIGYGVAVQGLLFPNVNEFTSVVKGIIFRPLFQLFGELFLDDVRASASDGSCSTDATEITIHGDEPCPQNIEWGLVFLVIYVVLCNILLLNIFIAMFSGAVEIIQDKSNLHWSFQYYLMTMQFYHKPRLPPPFIIIEHCWLVLRAIWPWGTENKIDDQDDLNIIKREEWYSYNYIRRKQTEKFDNSIERVLVQLKDIKTRIKQIENPDVDDVTGIMY